MEEFKRKKRDISVENVRDVGKEQDYFDKIDDSAWSDSGLPYQRKSLRSAKGSSRKKLHSFINDKEEEKKLFKGSKKKSSDGREDIEQPGTESSDQFQIDRLLQNFDPNEFLVPSTLQETIYIQLLKLRANLPMYTTLFIIYGISITYLLTYLLPLLWKDYNEKFQFLVEDKNRFISLYSKDPNPTHFIFLLLPYLALVVLITIALVRATLTSPGSINNGKKVSAN